ncbi:MAG: Lpg1974 family pore-forming outer membrane protein [Candidatus Rhabdochlamydia sp.]
MNSTQCLLFSSILFIYPSLIASSAEGSCEQCHHLAQNGAHLHMSEKDMVAASNTSSALDACSYSPRNLLKISGEFLYLRAVQEGVDYALIAASSDIPPFDISEVVGTLSHFKPSFKPGYRLEASYLLPHDKGGISLNWMHYAMDTFSQISSASNQVVIPFLLNQDYNPQAASADGQWKLKLNALDLTYDLSFMISSQFSLTPFAGARAAWISQHLLVQYNEVYYPGYRETAAQDIANLNWMVNSYGPVAGVGMNWNLFNKISFFTTGTASLLMGRSHPHLDETAYISNSTGAEPEIRANIQDSFWFNNPVFELSAGLAYEHDWDKGGFAIQAGWEEQLWVNQNLKTNFISADNHGISHINHGNLGLSGYTLKASLKF